MIRKILFLTLIICLLAGCKASPVLNDTPSNMMPESQTEITGWSWIEGTPIEQNDITVRPGDEFKATTL